ncbi:MAG: hypothetical protein DRN14_05905 [Thermoplasmata archaeon]|nr:MAG: hypothetical protein DRN14_05905 [Thermoplasmata archaeon]
MSDIISKGRFPINHSNKEGNFLDIKLAYDKSGDISNRGIYMYIKTKIVKDGMETYEIFDDITGNDIQNSKIFVKPLKRKNQKQFDIVDDKLNFEQIAKLWIAKDYVLALELIRDGGLS